MSDSTENTNELDSYGVWVKNTPEAEVPLDTNTSDPFDFTSSLDLPDFDDICLSDTTDTDLENIFDDSPVESASEPESNPLYEEDATLNSDELQNITNSADFIETEAEDTPEEIITDSPVEDSFSFDETLSDIPSEESSISSFDLDESLDESLNETLTNDISVDDIPVDETSIDDFSFDDITSEDLPVDETTSDTALPEDSALDLPSMDEPAAEEVSLEDSLNFTENEIDTSALDAFSMDDVPSEPVEENQTDILNTSETTETDESTEETADDFTTENMNTEDFIEDVPSEPVEQDYSADEFESFTVSKESPSDDEEISLDDFMDKGFSDESVASGNNGYEAGAQPENGSEEISLDDFLDGGFEEDKQKEEEEFIEEKPLDMNISFDDSADIVKTEDNLSIDEDFDDDMDFTDTSDNTNVEDETVSVSSSSSSDNFDSEEIDLSDFGIDTDAEETPVTQDIEASKIKEEVIDYDLQVENDTTTSAPIVNEIRSSDSINKIESFDQIENAISEPAKTSGTTAIDNSLLQQIVQDLTSLKDEISTLKSNLSDMKAKEANGYAVNSIIEEEKIIEETKDEGGFFGDGDEDNTIALSNDELNNIMNTTSVIESEEPQMDISEDAPVEVVEEAPLDQIEETAVSENELNDISISTDDVITTPELTINEDLSMNFNDDNLEEPVIDTEAIMESDVSSESGIIDDDLPQEIEIEKDDLLVESSSTDFMESITDSTPAFEAAQTLDSDSLDVIEPEDAVEETETIENIEEPVEEVSEPTLVDTIMEDNPLSEFETINTEDNGETETFTDVFTTEPETSSNELLDSVIDNSEPIIEETSIEEDPFDTVENAFDTTENTVEDTTDKIMEETVVQAAPVIAAVNSTDDNMFVTEETKTELTDSNINYLTSDNAIPAEMAAEESNAELKKDIKSVLLYMDQLLENLPEDKIVEFAKSEEFTTYKKLFSELGLN